MEFVKRNLCRSKHKYELKLKIKITKGSKTQQIQIKQNYQNQETIKPNKVLLWFDDILEEHDLDKTHMDSEIKRLKEHKMNQIKLQ